MKNEVKNMLDFIDRSPTAYHTADNIAKALTEAGFTRLDEGKRWQTEEGGRYFTVRNSSSVIAFIKGKAGAPFMICSSHSDFPAFKVKEEENGVYVRLSTEKYGGMIMYSWFDRPLSVAGRVIVREGGALSERLLNIDRDLLVIPSVAIHLSNDVNNGFAPNPAIDLLPLFSLDKGATLRSLIASELSVSEESIISHDLFLYAREKGKLIGKDSEFILSPRIDNLECVYAALSAFLCSEKTEETKVLAVFDNEEVGSETKEGAASAFLSEVLERISEDRESYFASASAGLMVSADNAHAKHPAHPELSDKASSPLLGGGVVIKYNANKRYATDAVSSALFEEISISANAKIQAYRNRADKIGGSTLGSIATTKVSIPTVDIGLSELAMHSAVETAAVSDLSDMISALTKFYSVTIRRENGKIVVK